MNNMNVKLCSNFTVLLIAMLGTQTALANDTPENLDKGKYRLELTARPAVPYPSIPNYNSSLTESGSGESYQVEVSRHHIIPFNVLQTFFNNIIIRSGEQFRFRSALHQLNLNMPYYASSAAVDCTSGVTSDLYNAGVIAERMGYNDFNGGGESFIEGTDDLHQYYSWLPGNLFIGPNSRSDDPGEGFELNARTIVGQDNFAILQSLYNNLVSYNAGNTSLIGAIAADFSTIAKRRGVYQLNAEHWGLSNGKYYIKHTSSTNSKSIKGNLSITQSETGDSCTNVTKELAIFNRKQFAISDEL